MRAASASAAGNRAELFPCQSEELKVDPVQTFIVISLHSPNAAAVINQTNLSLITQAFSNFMCQSQEVKVDRDTSTFKFLGRDSFQILSWLLKVALCLLLEDEEKTKSVWKGRGRWVLSQFGRIEWNDGRCCNLPKVIKSFLTKLNEVKAPVSVKPRSLQVF